MYEKQEISELETGVENDTILKDLTGPYQERSEYENSAGPKTNHPGTHRTQLVLDDGLDMVTRRRPPVYGPANATACLMTPSIGNTKAHRKLSPRVIYIEYTGNNFNSAIQAALAKYPTATVIAIPTTLKRIIPKGGGIVYQDLRNGHFYGYYGHTHTGLMLIVHPAHPP